MADMKNSEKENSENETLLLCPFCNGEAVLQLDPYEYLTPSSYWVVMCRKCDVKTCGLNPKEEAIKAWNTRHNKSQWMSIDKEKLEKCMTFIQNILVDNKEEDIFDSINKITMKNGDTYSKAEFMMTVIKIEARELLKDLEDE